MRQQLPRAVQRKEILVKILSTRTTIRHQGKRNNKLYEVQSKTRKMLCDHNVRGPYSVDVALFLLQQGISPNSVLFSSQ